MSFWSLGLVCATPKELADIAIKAASCGDTLGCSRIDSGEWERSPYLPTLTIIEAAEKIFAGHQVREISHATGENIDRNNGDDHPDYPAGKGRQ